MFSQIKKKFRSNPLLFYSTSIAATWAGVNSLMGGIEIAQNYGIIPYLWWAFGNIIACMVFGIFAQRTPKLREIFKSKPMKIIVGLLCPFQVWISLNGISSIFATTPLGSVFGKVIAYTIAIIFIIILWRKGMIRNILTDHASWVAVYALILGLAIMTFIANGSYLIPLGTEPSSVIMGMQKCVLLIPGPYLYPYYFELLEYNDQNDDNTKKVNIQKAFILGGLLFGIYLLFTFALAFTRFGPITSVIKAVLITLIAISSLSSFQYSLYITFGKKIGLAANIATVLFWPLVISLGVMGVWTIMATIRIYIVLVSIAVALLWNYTSERKAGRL